MTWIWGLTAGDYMRMGPAKDWLPFRESRFSEFPIERECTTFGAANLVLYRLPDVIKAVADGATIYIAEGEKDADSLPRSASWRQRMRWELANGRIDIASSFAALT